MTHLSKISHCPLIGDGDFSLNWEYFVADFPKRYQYSSGMNHPSAFKI